MPYIRYYYTGTIHLPGFPVHYQHPGYRARISENRRNFILSMDVDALMQSVVAKKTVATQFLLNAPYLVLLFGRVRPAAGSAPAFTAEVCALDHPGSKCGNAVHRRTFQWTAKGLPCVLPCQHCQA